MQQQRAAETRPRRVRQTSSEDLAAFHELVVTRGKPHRMVYYPLSSPGGRRVEAHWFNGAVETFKHLAIGYAGGGALDLTAALNAIDIEIRVAALARLDKTRVHELFPRFFDHELEARGIPTF